jgi:hypothetical protein
MLSGEGADFSFGERDESNKIGDDSLSEFRSHPRTQLSSCRSSALVTLNHVAGVEPREQGVSS